MTRRDPTSPKLGQGTGDAAARFLRVVRGHHDPARHSPDGVIDRVPPKVRDALARSTGDVAAPLDVKPAAPPTDAEHEATFAAMLGDLDELTVAHGAAARGEDLDVGALGGLSTVAVARWERLRSCLGDAHPLTRRARAVQVQSTVLATDWIPSLVLAHRQAARGLP